MMLMLLHSAVRVAAILISVMGCYSQPKPPPAPPVPTETHVTGCSEAAAGLERGTRGIRPPEISVLSTMRARCEGDRWSVSAIECFAAMKEDDLGKCAAKLSTSPRDRMFAALGGGFEDRTAIAIAIARLEYLQVGVEECDHFISTVKSVLACEALAIETRAQLGAETADFWSLPTHGLSPDAQTRMATACNESLKGLQQQASAAGCMP